MNKLNGDGNLFGRITAFGVLVAALVGVGHLSGAISCPMSAGCASCPVSGAPAAPVSPAQ